MAFLKRYDDKKLTRAIEILTKTYWELFYLGGLERKIKPRPTYNHLSEKWDGEYNEDYDYIIKWKSEGWNQSFV